MAVTPARCARAGSHRQGSTAALARDDKSSGARAQDRLGREPHVVGMRTLTDTRIFWWGVAALLHPPLLLACIATAVMPPLNVLFTPVLLLVLAGVVGGVSNGLEQAARAARRNAPGVVPVQRTKAL